MGLIANYMMVGRETLDHMKTLNNDLLLEQIEDCDEEGNPVYDMDKLWDGLHFLLTGVSSDTPPEGNALSEAVIGINIFSKDDDETDFISYIPTEELSRIIAAMEKTDMNLLRQSFDPLRFNSADIYPNIWSSEEKNVLWDELSSEFDGLLRFYKEAWRQGKDIVVSIY